MFWSPWLQHTRHCISTEASSRKPYAKSHRIAQAQIVIRSGDLQKLLSPHFESQGCLHNTPGGNESHLVLLEWHLFVLRTLRRDIFVLSHQNDRLRRARRGEPRLYQRTPCVGFGLIRGRVCALPPAHDAGKEPPARLVVFLNPSAPVMTDRSPEAPTARLHGICRVSFRCRRPIPTVHGRFSGRARGSRRS